MAECLIYLALFALVDQKVRRREQIYFIESRTKGFHPSGNTETVRGNNQTFNNLRNRLNILLRQRF